MNKSEIMFVFAHVPPLLTTGEELWWLKAVLYKVMSDVPVEKAVDLTTKELHDHIAVQHGD